MFGFRKKKQETDNSDNAPVERRGFFSTDEFDTSSEGVKAARTRLATLQDRIRQLRPIVDVTPTGAVMDGADDGPGDSIKDAFDWSLPEVSEALLAWYGAQTFIGHQLCGIIAQHWLIEKCCAMAPRDAVRNGYKVTTADGGDFDPKVSRAIMKADRRFALNGQMREFLTKGRVFGVRVVMFKVDSIDPAYYEKPFNPDGITPGSYKGMVQIDPYWTAPQLDADAASNPASLHFYEPTYWLIRGQRVHRSHLIIYRRGILVDYLKPVYLYGGIPLPQQIMERVYAAERTANEGPILAMTKRTTVFKTNIAKALANFDKFRRKIWEWVSMRDNHQVRVIDKEEDDIDVDDTSLTDLDAVIMTQYQLVAAEANTPATKLLGTTPKGFNSSGEYEEANYREEQESLQEEATPLADRHHLCLMRSEIAPKFGLDKNTEIEMVWNPLDSPTALETAQAFQARATAYAALVDLGAIDGQDVRDVLRADPESGFAGIKDKAPEELTDDAEFNEGDENADSQAAATQDTR